MKPYRKGRDINYVGGGAFMADEFIDAFIQAGCSLRPGEEKLTGEQRRAYERQQEEYNRLFDQIEKKLGDDYRLMRRLEETANSLYSSQEEWIYQKGFSDCIRLLKWMDAFE